MSQLWRNRIVQCYNGELISRCGFAREQQGFYQAKKSAIANLLCVRDENVIGSVRTNGANEKIKIWYRSIM